MMVCMHDKKAVHFAGFLRPPHTFCSLQPYQPLPLASNLCDTQVMCAAWNDQCPSCVQPCLRSSTSIDCYIWHADGSISAVQVLTATAMCGIIQASLAVTTHCLPWPCVQYCFKSMCHLLGRNTSSTADSACAVMLTISSGCAGHHWRSTLADCGSS